MSNRIKEHFDHTKQSVFHHGLIKLIICTILQKKNRSWDHFLFWSGFTNEQDDHVKKSLTIKQFGVVKIFKKEVIEDLVQYSFQEDSSCQIFRDPGNEDQGKALRDEKEYILEDEKREKTLDLDPEEYISSIEQKKNSICVQEISTIVSFAANSKGNILQVPNLKVEKKSLMQLERSKWGPKTRATNKLNIKYEKNFKP